MPSVTMGTVLPCIDIASFSIKRRSFGANMRVVKRSAWKTATATKEFRHAQLFRDFVGENVGIGRLSDSSRLRQWCPNPFETISSRLLKFLSIHPYLYKPDNHLVGFSSRQ